MSMIDLSGYTRIQNAIQEEHKELARKLDVLIKQNTALIAQLNLIATKLENIKNENPPK